MLDASAIIAVIADEPESKTVINYTKNATIVSPSIISCEIANALTRMMKKNIVISSEQMSDFIMKKIGKELGLTVLGG